MGKGAQYDPGASGPAQEIGRRGVAVTARVLSAGLVDHKQGVGSRRFLDARQCSCVQPTADRIDWVGEYDHPARARCGRDESLDIDAEVCSRLDVFDGSTHQGGIVPVQGKGRIERHNAITRSEHRPRHDRDELFGSIADHHLANWHAEAGAERAAKAQTGRIGIEPDAGDRPARGGDGARARAHWALI